jgi:hypothetical protein
LPDLSAAAAKRQVVADPLKRMPGKDGLVIERQ